MVGHAHDEVRLVLEVDAALLERRIRLVDVVYAKVQYRAWMVELRGFRQREHDSHSTAVKKCHFRWRLEEEAHSQGIAIELHRARNIMGIHRDLANRAESLQGGGG